MQRLWVDSALIRPFPVLSVLFLAKFYVFCVIFVIYMCFENKTQLNKKEKKKMCLKLLFFFKQRKCTWSVSGRIQVVALQALDLHVAQWTAQQGHHCSDPVFRRVADRTCIEIAVRTGGAQLMSTRSQPLVHFPHLAQVAKLGSRDGCNGREGKKTASLIITAELCCQSTDPSVCYPSISSYRIKTSNRLHR